MKRISQDKPRVTRDGFSQGQGLLAKEETRYFEFAPPYAFSL